MGAYTISGLNLPQNAMIHSVGAYVIPALDLRFRGVMTTTTPVGAYRGAGRPYGTGGDRARDGRARARAAHGPDRAAPPQPGAGRPASVRDRAHHRRARARRLRQRRLPALHGPGARDARPARGAPGAGGGCARRAATSASASSTTWRPPPPCRTRARWCACTPTARVTVVSGAAPQGQGHVTMFSRLVGRRARGRRRRDRGADRRHRAGRDGRRHLRQPHRGDRRQRGAAGLARGARQGAPGGRAPARGRARPTWWSRPAASRCAGCRAARSAGPRSRPRRTPARCPARRPGLEDTHVFAVSQSSFANGTHAVVLEVDPETGAVDRAPLDRGPRLRPRARARHRGRPDPRRRWCRACPTRSTCSSPTTRAASASPRP